MLTALIIGLGMAVPAGLWLKKATAMKVLKKEAYPEHQDLFVSRWYLEKGVFTALLFSSGLLYGMHFDNFTIGFLSAMGLSYSAVYTLIGSISELNVQTLQYVFKQQDIGAMIEIACHVEEEKRIERFRSHEIGDHIYAIDGMLIEEFLYNKVSKIDFMKVLALKQKLVQYMDIQDAKFETGITSQQLQFQDKLALEIRDGFKALRQTVGSIEKPILNVVEVTGNQSFKDPVLENISELLSSEEVTDEKKVKLETLQQDVMQKLEESKKHYGRDMEAEAVLVAGANYHRLNKTY